MINNEIIKLASNSSNVGLKNKYSHKITFKNSTCGDKITLELIIDKKKISSMRYETESCIYCEASASVLSNVIKNYSTSDIKKDFLDLKERSKQRNFKIPKKFKDLKKILNSDNLDRIKCIFLPFDAVIKALDL